MTRREVDPEQAPFGRHVRRLREVRGLTQEQLAERSDVAADTVRRLEHGGFSPSLATLRRVSRGLGLPVGTLFASFELLPNDEVGDLVALVAGSGSRTVRLILRLARVVIDAKRDDRC